MRNDGVLHGLLPMEFETRILRRVLRWLNSRRANLAL
jgi:CelD/BcsL family acetyltransferase involved in cellulose biosynthesis